MKPQSQASVAAFQTSKTFPVTYTSSDLGGSAGSGVVSVELWVKGPADAAFTNTDVDSGAGLDSKFSFTAGPDGVYKFYTVAVDAAGNREASPATDLDSAVVDTHVDTVAPVSSASSPDYSNDGSVSVSYLAEDSADGASGLASVELW